MRTPSPHSKPTCAIRDAARIPWILRTHSRSLWAPILPLLIGCLLLAARSVSSADVPQSALTRFTYTQYHMGVDARMVVYAPDENAAVDACAAAYKRIAALDSIMSDYQQNSELNRL